MSLKNETLATIQDIFSPSLTKEEKSIKEETVKEEQNNINALPGNKTETSFTSNTTSTNTPSTSNIEFIPHIFYSLHNITKDPNNSSNQLETATGVIRHKLRSSKQCLMENSDTKILLNKSVNDWEQFIQKRENELNLKKTVLQQLNERIKSINEQTV